MSLYEHVPHPRLARRKEHGPVKVHDMMKKASPVQRLNSRLGLGITIIVGSMWAAYAFTLLALISLPSAIKSHDVIIIVAWIAQTFLQLVLLPIIIVGQNIQAAAADKRSEQTYLDAEAVLQQAERIQAHLLVQDAALEALAAKAGVVLQQAASS